MEYNLYDYMFKERDNLHSMALFERRKTITDQAIRLTNYPNTFKASKGWFDKFLERFNINIDEIY